MTCPTGLAGREMVLERVATHSRNAATVTQGAGLPCKGSPAPFSHLVLASSRSGAGGLGRSSEADREEPGAMKSATGPAGEAMTWGQA